MGKKVDRSTLTPEQLAELRAYGNKKAKESYYRHREKWLSRAKAWREQQNPERLKEAQALLCDDCNVGLGRLGDGDIGRLRAAITYLERVAIQESKIA